MPPKKPLQLAAPKAMHSRLGSPPDLVSLSKLHVGHEECVSGTYRPRFTLAVEFLYFLRSSLL